MNDCNKKLFYLIFALGILTSCSVREKPKEWTYSKTIKLDGVNPIGITTVNNSIWLSDGDHNRLVQLNAEGKITQTIDSLDRPMHIASYQNTIYVPQYGNDKIEAFENGKRKEIIIKDSIDAPASIAITKTEKAIADFYNNRVLFFDGDKWISIGSKGEHEGEFNYPTDVQITDSIIWVADAYNNRIQAFDKQGQFVKKIGEAQKMNAATGLFISSKEVLITDFENNRVLVFDHEGELKQELKEGIAKATDLLIQDDLLYIVNYRTGELVLYNLVEKTET